MGKTTKNWDRQFGGKLDRFTDKDEKIKEKKHLKAYLRGDEKFIHGFTNVKNPITGMNELIPKWHEVKQLLIDLR